MTAPDGTGTTDADDYILIGKDSSGSGETAKCQFVDIPLETLTTTVILQAV